MRAAIHRRYGPPEVLQLVSRDIPEPKANEVQIRMVASSVTSGDWHMRKADPFAVRLFNGLWKPKLTCLGSEVAGVVTAVGDQVSRFSIGDEVFGATGLALGANAEYLCLAQDAPIAVKPANISFREAAAIPFGAVTALYFLKQQAQLQPGQTVLIYGAAGAVGIYAVQIAKILGARVTAVCRSKNHDMVRRMGADEVMDYQQQDYHALDRQWDVVLDSVGKTDFNLARKVLSPHGQFLACAGQLKEMRQLLFNALLRLLKLETRQLKMGIAIEQQADIEWFARLIESGQLRAVIDSEYPLDEIVAAHRYVEQGHKVGSVVLTFDGPE